MCTVLNRQFSFGKNKEKKNKKKNSFKNDSAGYYIVPAASFFVMLVQTTAKNSLTFLLWGCFRLLDSTTTTTTTSDFFLIGSTNIIRGHHHWRQGKRKKQLETSQDDRVVFFFLCVFDPRQRPRHFLPRSYPFYNMFTYIFCLVVFFFFLSPFFQTPRDLEKEFSRRLLPLAPGTFILPTWQQQQLCASQIYCKYYSNHQIAKTFSCLQKHFQFQLFE